jgi:hypothetical protein
MQLRGLVESREKGLQDTRAVVSGKGEAKAQIPAGMVLGICLSIRVAATVLARAKTGSLAMARERPRAAGRIEVHRTIWRTFSDQVRLHLRS